VVIVFFFKKKESIVKNCCYGENHDDVMAIFLVYIYCIICQRTIIYIYICGKKKEIPKKCWRIIERNNTKYSRYRNGDGRGCCYFSFIFNKKNVFPK